MKKNRIIIFSALITLLFIGIGCDKKIGKLPPEETTTGTPVNACDTITYNKHIKAIIKQNCYSCHNETSPSSQPNLNSYALLRLKAEQGRIKARVIEGNPSFMPRDTANPSSSRELSRALKDIISCWLNNGMKE